MAKKKVYNKELSEKVSKLRKGSRVVGMGAINRSGAGAHKSKKAKDNWRKDWEM